MCPRDEIRHLIKLHERTTYDNRKFILVEPLTRALEAKYPDLNTTLYNIIREAHEHNSREPPDILKDQLPSMCRILYALIDLGYPALLPLFSQHRDEHLPIPEDTLAELDVFSGQSELRQLWLQAQTAWCPFTFELGRTLNEKVHHRIIPFYAKIPIQPYGAGQKPPDNSHARLYQVHIPKELVKSSELDASQLLRCDDPPGSPPRTYWRFALKEFPETLKQSFEKEVKTFRALGAQSGMIGYYGCYESTNESGQPTYGILLEYADFDLNGAIHNEEPPVSPDEIRSFYESMHEVAATLTNIHHLDIEGQKYDFWHGDIKPENILRVGDHFKLSDPGDSWIQRAPKDGRLLSRAEVYGGTRTYAAPEKARWLEDKPDAIPDEICQNSDVWSLGCVFSIAATYVVLGEQGVVLYDNIRRHAHAKPDTDLIQDVFHANGDVLKVIKGWHTYLRLSARRGDVFTAAILDMVDDHMLVMPPEKRWEAKEVSEYFSNLIKTSCSDSQEVPEVIEIENILRELDLRAEIDQESEGGINRLDSDIAKRQFRQEKTEARTTRRSRFKSEAELLGTRIKPTAQRSVHRRDLLKRYNQLSETQRLPTIVSPPMSANPNYVTTGEPATVPSDFPTDSSAPEMFTIFQMKEQLEAVGRDRSLGPLKVFKDLRKHRPIKGAIDEDWLLPHYKDRDIVFLVDNGPTMGSHWYEATFVLEALVWRVLGYDSDGIELYFTNPDPNPHVKPSKKQNVQTFVDAMGLASPKLSQTKTKTKLRPRLSKIMRDFNDAREKPRTVLILTDGIWEGMPYEADIDEWVKENLCELAGQDPKTLQSPSREPTGGEGWQANFEKSRPITFQFICFGHSGPGKSRMERLDNLLRDQGLPDLIDMEPSSGDAYKMLLGSLVPFWDEKSNPVNPSRAFSPVGDVYSPSITGIYPLGPDQQTPRSSTMSIQYPTPESSDPRWASGLSLVPSPLHLDTTWAGENSGSSGQNSGNRQASVSRSPSRRSKASNTSRFSGFFHRSDRQE